MQRLESVRQNVREKFRKILIWQKLNFLVFALDDKKLKPTFGENLKANNIDATLQKRHAAMKLSKQAPPAPLSARLSADWSDIW